MRSSLEKLAAYELYQEIAEELSAPVDPELDCFVRFELYQSKLVFLRNLREQCFRAINSVTETPTSFTQLDLQRIQLALETTQVHLKETILESVQMACDRRKLA